jgi:hypothetical protein
LSKSLFEQTDIPAQVEIGALDRIAAPRAIFVLHLVAGPNCPDATRALRQLLKIALRRFGLRFISVEKAQP